MRLPRLSLPEGLRRASWPLRAVRLYTRLRGARKDHPALRGLGAIQLQSRRAGVSEYEAQSAVGAITILHVTRDDPGTVARNVHFAYENVAASLSLDGPFTVMEPLALVESAGVVVLRRPDARELSTLIRSGSADVAGGLTRAGAWLATLHAAFDTRPGAFDARERLDETTYPYRRWLDAAGLGEDPMLPVVVLAERAAPLFEGDIVDFVKFHKDFAPRSVLLTPDQTIVRDLVNTRRRPRAYDLAHFLVEAAIDAGTGLTDRDALGLPTGYREAVMSGYGMSGGAMHRMLRFAVLARIVDIYTSGMAAHRNSALFEAKRVVLVEMARAIADQASIADTAEA